jgi:hypothetical protein
MMPHKTQASQAGELQKANSPAVSVTGAQFADAPALANPDQITLREEDRIQAYFASGHLYAEPGRAEPLL